MPDITLLGTGGMLPLKDRFLTSLYVEHNGKALLIDCGEGTQVAVATHGLKLSKIEAILITHLHADHIAGLPGLLLSLGNTGRSHPLPIYCGDNAAEFVRHALFVAGGLPFEVHIHRLPEQECSKITFGRIDERLVIETLPLCHRVPCLGYRLTFGKKPEFMPENARALGIPVEYWKTLHDGESVTLPDGRTVTPEEVTGAARSPVRIVYTTDTLPIPEIVAFAEQADLFVCEGMWGMADKKESMDQKRHMLMQDACKLAKQAQVKCLWLTHYSPAEKEPVAYQGTLQSIFAQTTISQDGQHLQLK